MMSLSNLYPSLWIQPVLQWCAYFIASQQAIVGVHNPARTNALIIMASLEQDNNPYMFNYVDNILDNANYLHGEMSYCIGGAGLHANLTKAHGGYNLLCKNTWTNSEFHWTTAQRPTNPGSGTRGFNLTTKKLEFWDESAWVATT